MQAMSQPPQGAAATASAVGQACDSLGVQYMGGPLSSGVRGGWLYPAVSGWASGERSVNCTLMTVDASGNPTTSTGSLAHQG
jgi:hypothetical protein